MDINGLAMGDISDQWFSTTDVLRNWISHIWGTVALPAKIVWFWRLNVARSR